MESPLNSDIRRGPSHKLVSKILLHQLDLTPHMGLTTSSGERSIFTYNTVIFLILFLRVYFHFCCVLCDVTYILFSNSE